MFLIIFRKSIHVHKSVRLFPQIHHNVKSIKSHISMVVHIAIFSKLLFYEYKKNYAPVMICGEHCTPTVNCRHSLHQLSTVDIAYTNCRHSLHQLST